MRARVDAVHEGSLRSLRRLSSPKFCVCLSFRRSAPCMAPMRAFVILLAAASTHGFLVPSPALVGHRGTEAARQLVGCAAEKRLRRHSSPRLSEPERKWQAPPGLEPDAIVLLWYYGCINLVRDCAYRFQISGLPFKKLNELGWDFPALSQASTHPPSSPLPSRAHARTCTACRCACCIAPCEVSSLANQALGGAAALAWTWVLG